MGISFFLRTGFVSVLFLLNLFYSFGQFEGGQGSGYDTLNFPNSICSSFYGNSNSGYTALHNPSGGNCGMFFGDSSSGYNALHNPSGGNCNMFIGGEFSGQNNTHYVNPNSTCFLFTESVNGGSGHSVRAYSADNLNQCAIIALGVEASPLFGEVDENGRGRLYWQTYSERNNSGFEIQRAADGQTWETIGWVDGAGSSTSTLEYEFFDSNLSSQGQYYRFRQVDFDGMTSYSNIVLLSLKTPASLEDIFVLFPNPASQSNGLKLKGWVKKEWRVELTVVDPTGRVLFSEKQTFDQGKDVFEFPMDIFTSGTYYLFLKPENNATNLRIPFVVIN